MQLFVIHFANYLIPPTGLLLLLFKLHCKINKDLSQVVAEVNEKFIIK